MTRSANFAVAAALLLSGHSLSAQPAGNAEVQAQAKAFHDAQAAGDGAALDRLMAPDALFVRANGRIGDKQDFIRGFTAAGHSLQPIRIVDPLFIRAGEDVAIVGGEARLEGSDGGQPIRQHFRFSETYARRAGRWMVVYIQITGLPVE